MTTATETLLHHPENATSVPFRPYSRSKTSIVRMDEDKFNRMKFRTTYGSMNSWAKKDGSSLVPEPSQSAAFQRGFADDAKADSYYNRYMRLSANVADKHPNPGVPRERMGRIGGSWRHIKEVLGYTGTQVCFVDGLVSLYDKETMQNGTRRGPAWRARLAGPAGYSANLAASQDFRMGKPGPRYEMDHDCTTSGGDSKHKGFYTMRQ